MTSILKDCLRCGRGYRLGHTVCRVKNNSGKVRIVNEVVCKGCALRVNSTLPIHSKKYPCASLLGTAAGTPVNARSLLRQVTCKECRDGWPPKAIEQLDRELIRLKAAKDKQATADYDKVRTTTDDEDEEFNRLFLEDADA